ncbi:dihydrofolate reductase family protein [Echinicola jeungdonensis]|uniref:Dihydrofolate reductase family protein n=1 Tax=Echinicola jeungdonensis TaxID=709343 RepID=A0ABV5J7L6_9BACT|nr:dihydrofolate reductase family protein [Echinicola jeungdonensis]MDN3669718.1 dihydrofolate reductase family protein [Echinicola jeungdonensis]
MSRRVILYIAMSLDGYIAKDEGNIDFLNKVDVPGEDYGYEDFQRNVDTVIWGRKTYDKLLSFNIPFPHKDKKCFVLSRNQKGKNEDVEFYGGGLKELISKLKSQKGMDIYCDGGGEAVFGLLKEKLIDRMIVSVIPYLVGKGVRLFKDGRPEQDIELIKSVAYPSGLVQLWYEVK